MKTLHIKRAKRGARTAREKNGLTERIATYKYLVVGAGPAGLAFASTLNAENVLVVDLGKPISQRCRHSPEECVQGAGGAGLFSDGKFSFYPAGTQLWKTDENRLKVAYKALEKDLKAYGPIPPFPEITHGENCLQDKAGWCFKPYPCLYIALSDRYDLINTLANRCPRIMYETEFVNYHEVDDGYLIKLKNKSSNELFYVKTEKLILAGGRFMPLFLNSKKRFRRYEFGFRIAGPIAQFQKEVSCNDPKYLFYRPGVEYRTFCWCESGEVVKTRFKGIESYSGRSDCTPTDTTNFGFNIRVKDASLLPESDFQKVLTLPPFEIALSSFIDNLQDYYPASAARLIEYGLDKLLKRFCGLNHKSISVIGPTIEGVGDYPAVDTNFQLEGATGISVIGDCGGSYRGIIPSMLSGYCLAYSYNQKEIYL